MFKEGKLKNKCWILLIIVIFSTNMLFARNFSPQMKGSFVIVEAGSDDQIQTIMMNTDWKVRVLWIEKLLAGHLIKKNIVGDQIIKADAKTGEYIIPEFISDRGRDFSLIRLMIVDDNNKPFTETRSITDISVYIPSSVADFPADQIDSVSPWKNLLDIELSRAEYNRIADEYYDQRIAHIQNDPEDSINYSDDITMREINLLIDKLKNTYFKEKSRKETLGKIVEFTRLLDNPESVMMKLREVDDIDPLLETYIKEAKDKKLKETGFGMLRMIRNMHSTIKDSRFRWPFRNEVSFGEPDRYKSIPTQDKIFPPYSSPDVGINVKGYENTNPFYEVKPYRMGAEVKKKANKAEFSTPAKKVLKKVEEKLIKKSEEKAVDSSDDFNDDEFKDDESTDEK